MDLHLFSTDPSGLELLKLLPQGDRVTALILPENRLHSAKVERLVVAASDLPQYVHRRGALLGDELPPAEAAISWLYSQVILAQDLAHYSKGILNMHGGSIPEYRGASVLHWAIINGEEELGITWHKLVEEVDAGPISAETKIPIPSEATAPQVRESMIAEGIRLFPGAWMRFRGGKESLRSPDLTRGQVWPQRKPTDGRIEVGWPERRLRDMVRALHPPWPAATIHSGGAWVLVEGVLDCFEDGAVAYSTAEGKTVYLKVKLRP